jgi:hypothetical protein
MVFINDCFGTSIHLPLSYLTELYITNTKILTRGISVTS